MYQHQITHAQLRELHIRPHPRILPLLLFPHEQCGQGAGQSGDVPDDCAGQCFRGAGFVGQEPAEHQRTAGPSCAAVFAGAGEGGHRGV